jgi:hypothetical protein
MILFFTFCVILATLVAQGLSLPWLIRRLEVRNDGEEEREELRARLAAAKGGHRSLVLGGAWGENVLVSLAWTAGILAVFGPLAIRRYRRGAAGA